MTANKLYIPREETIDPRELQLLRLLAKHADEVEASGAFLRSLPESLQPLARKRAELLKQSFNKLDDFSAKR